jgi:phospholipid transport system substrate-binding protein
MPLKLLVHSVALGLCFVAGMTGPGTSANAAAALNADSKTPAANEVEQFVQASIDKGFLILNNKDLDARARQKLFREFLFALIDTKRTATFTLGPYARQASPEEFAMFLTAYNNFVATMFQGYFDWYKGEALRVSNSVARSADDVVVFADIVGPDGKRRFRAGFRVRHDSAGNNVVTDFQFEGAWFVLTQRADFTGYLQQHNGDFAGLSAELDKRTERFKKDWAPPAK